MMHLTEVLFGIASIILVLYFWIKYHFSYWKRKNVPNIKANPLFGNLTEMVSMSVCPGVHFRNLYNHTNAKDEPIVGIHIFQKPALVLRDPEVLKLILVKDFNKFCNRFSAADPHHDALGGFNLFFIKNPYWKELRSKLTPTFTSGKIKQMFPLVKEVGKELDQYLCDLPIDPETNSCVREVKEISALFTTDAVATIAFGVQANSLKNPNGEFRKNGQRVFDFTIMRAIEFTGIFFMPQLVKLLRFNVFSKESTKFIRDTLNFVMSQRIKDGNTRNDLIDILVTLKKQAKTGGGGDVNDIIALDNDILAAQAGVFFTAGFETSSSTLAFSLYELSKKPEIQKRLREEIKEALLRNGGQLTYEMLNEMKYMNKVIQEVLRLYPIVPFLDRECTLTEDEKEYSLKPHSDFAIPNGMPVYVPVYAIHRDPKYFPNPDDFDPERFSPENKANIKQFTYMPFGAGPHNCIGERFGQMQTRVGLTIFLKNHYVTTCEKSLKNMVFEPKALVLQSKGGIFCKIVRDPLIKV